jgi:hypothetical protein
LEKVSGLGHQECIGRDVFIMLSFIPALGVVAVDNVACKAVEHGKRGDPWEVSIASTDARSRYCE